MVYSMCPVSTIVFYPIVLMSRLGFTFSFVSNTLNISLGLNLFGHGYFLMVSGNYTWVILFHLFLRDY